MENMGYLITINSIFHTADVPIFSRSLAPYLADPDARVRLAVVEAAVTEKTQRKGWGLPDLLVIWWDLMGFDDDLLVI